MLESRLFVYVYPPGTIPRVLYTDDVHHIAMRGAHYEDLTFYSHSPDAAGAPFAYVTPFTADDATVRVVYTGRGDGHVHELRQTASDWVHADLSQLSQAPPSMPSPCAYLTPWMANDATARVLYTGTDSDVHELRLTARGWVHAPLSRLSQAPPAVSAPFAYLTPWMANDATARVLYTGGPPFESGVHELRLTARGWVHADISPHLAPDADAPPFAIATPTARVYYLSNTDNHAHMLLLLPNGWRHFELD
jgi:hypothetical protein